MGGVQHRDLPFQHITTGEGGMVATDRDEVAARIRIMRLHGIDREVWNRYTSPGAGWKYDVVAAGYKYNMTDIQAALGLVQLAKLERHAVRRRRLAGRYLSALGGEVFFQMPVERNDVDHAWHLFVLRLNLETLSIEGPFYGGVEGA